MEVDTGIIVRSCGRVMYNVIASDGRLLRRHINQIRRRAVARAPEGHQLPLDVLLEEWSSSSSRPEPTQPELEPIVSEPTALPRSSPAYSSLAATTPMDVPLTTSSSLPPADLNKRHGGRTDQRLIDLPRRSSRIRSLPRRLGAYQLI